MALDSGPLGAVRGPDRTRSALRRMYLEARRRKDGAGMLKALDEAEARGSTVSGSVTQDEDVAMRGAAEASARQSAAIQSMADRALRERLEGGKERLKPKPTATTAFPPNSAVDPKTGTVTANLSAGAGGYGGAAGATGSAGAGGSAGASRVPGATMTPEEAAADMKRTATSILDDQEDADGAGRNLTDEEKKAFFEATDEFARPVEPRKATKEGGMTPEFSRRVVPANGITYYDADQKKIVSGEVPEGMEEVGIRGSGENAMPIYARKTVDYTIPRRNAIARNMERQRFLERARRTPGGADMVRRQDRQQTAQQAAEARATPEAVEKELYGGADANYAAMGRGASVDERRTLTTMQMRDRLRRQKAIRDEVARRRTRARLIGEIGPE